MDIKELEYEYKSLKGILNLAKKDIAEAPEGTLRIARATKSPIYYHRKKKSDRIGEYIKAADKDLAKKLAQKAYADEVVDILEKEIEAVENLITMCSNKDIITLYQGYNNARRGLIDPYVLSDDEYIKRWKNSGKDSNVPRLPADNSDVIMPEEISSPLTSSSKYPESLQFTTAAGENVRSKSEVIIADTLFRLGIPYKYEESFYYKEKLAFCPDFTALNVRKRKPVYIEHFGMIDSESYRDGFFWKIRNFEKMGIIQGVNLILTFEDKNHPFNIADYITAIEKMLL